MNVFFRLLRAGAPATLLLLLSFGPASQAEPSRTFGTPLDITEDLHHRMLAGLFEPEKEPLICVLAKTQPGPISHRAIPGAWLRVSWEMGSFRVRSDAKRGTVILHMGQQAALSHLEFSASSDTEGLVRDFRQWPTHPVLLESR